jgi:hypothetical protein
VNVPRKQITDAILSILQGMDLTGVFPTPSSGPAITSWAACEKDARIWSDVEQFQQPYCGIYCPDERVSDPQAFGLTKWIRAYTILSYFRTDAVPLEGTYNQDIIDNLLDAFDAAFAAPRKGEPTTLGGIVQDCMIDGTIFVDPGTLDQQCVIMLPVTILTGI